jgi:predicted RNase H-like HicB family nuclease
MLRASNVMKSFIAILCKDDESAFGLHFPDLPGCTAAGNTEDEAIANAAIALRLWAEDLDVLPQPSSKAQLRKRRDVREDIAAGGVAVLVHLITAGRKQRLNIMLEPGVIEATDLAAKAAGVSRSQFIERALEDGLARELGTVRLGKPQSQKRQSKTKTSA